MEKKIWALFSVENNYHQPKNNLVTFWFEKPDVKNLSLAFGLPDLADKNIYDAVNQYGEMLKNISSIHRGNKERVNGSNFRLEQIIEGKILKDK